jgi:hypothetical protein
MRNPWIVAGLLALLAACGDSEPVAPAVNPLPEPKPVKIPAEFRERIETLALATSDRREDQVKAWAAYRSLRDSGDELLPVLLRVPKDDRPLLAMLEGWMKSRRREAMELTPLGAELEFREELESPERRAKLMFRLESSAADDDRSETVEVDGTGLVRVRRADGAHERKLEDAELLPFLDMLVKMKFWLQRGIRQTGAKDETLVTISQIRAGEGGPVLVRQIEVWESEATIECNRPLMLIVALLREFAKPKD